MFRAVDKVMRRACEAEGRPVTDPTPEMYVAARSRVQEMPAPVPDRRRRILLASIVCLVLVAVAGSFLAGLLPGGPRPPGTAGAAAVSGPGLSPAGGSSGTAGRHHAVSVRSPRRGAPKVRHPAPGSPGTVPAPPPSRHPAPRGGHSPSPGPSPSPPRQSPSPPSSPGPSPSPSPDPPGQGSGPRCIIVLCL